MAPSRTKKARTSTTSDTSSRLEVVPTQSPARTPTRSPQKRVMGITESQKQALIDNLQLEVTERARKLRAQYALQAQSLRTRIELRINRIPTALRKANMGELYSKYTDLQAEKQHQEPKKLREVEVGSGGHDNLDKAAESSTIVLSANHIEPYPEQKPRGVKRNSDAIENTDQENLHEHDDRRLPNPKKRTKPGNTRQAANPSTVLSPKSANSRAVPQSPVRPTLGSPQKSYISRPVSPLKPQSPLKIASPAKMAAAAATATLAGMVQEKTKPGRPKAAAGRKVTNPATTTKGGVTRAKRGVAAELQEPEDVRKASNTSNISSFSTATTVVKPVKKGVAATGKKGDVGVRATGKKVMAATEAPPAGRRVLRKRA